MGKVFVQYIVGKEVPDNEDDISDAIMAIENEIRKDAAKGITEDDCTFTRIKKRTVEIPEEVLIALEGLEISKEKIDAMNEKELFNCYCQWEGIIGYGSTLWEIMHKLLARKMLKKS